MSYSTLPQQLVRKGVATTAFCFATIGGFSAARAQQAPMDDGSDPTYVTLFAGATMRMSQSSYGAVYKDEFNNAMARENALVGNPANQQMEDAFIASLAAYRDLSPVKMADAVNRVVNGKITYVSDSELYNRSDYWAAPAETLSALRGDCEDYALLKYKALRSLGVPADKLYLGVVSQGSNRYFADHAVLIMNVAENGQPPDYAVMSNGIDNLITPESSFAYFALVGERGYWVLAPQAEQRQPQHAAQEPEWHQERKKAQSEEEQRQIRELEEQIKRLDKRIQEWQDQQAQWQQQQGQQEVQDSKGWNGEDIAEALALLALGGLVIGVGFAWLNRYDGGDYYYNHKMLNSSRHPLDQKWPPQQRENFGIKLHNITRKDQKNADKNNAWSGTMRP